MSVDEAKTTLQRNRLKATNQRIALIQYLSKQNSPRPLSAISKNKQLHMNESTIFRNLEAFTKANLVNQYLIDSGVTHYELSLDGNIHHHIVCTNCNTIEELQDCPIQDMQTVLNQTHLFQKITSHQLCFYGTCTNCANYM